MLTSHISGSELLENVVLLFNECKKKDSLIQKICKEL